MKSYLSIIIASLFAVSLFSQSFIDKNYSQYTEKENATRVQVSGKLFDFAANFINESGDEDAAKVKEMVSKIKSFDLLMVPDLANPISEYNKGISALGNSLDELIRVKDKNTRFTLLVKEKNGIVSHITGLGAIDTSFIVFSLEGLFDLNELGAITSQIQNEGLKKFANNSTNVYEEVKVYPNPVSAGSLVSFELPESMKDASINIYDASGKLMTKNNAVGNSSSIETSNWSNGEYVAEISNGGTTIKKKFIVLK